MKFKSDIEVQAGLKDSSGSAGTSGKILSSTGTGVAWVDDNPGISGSGTVNYVSKFTGSTTLGNSLLFDDGTYVGIGTTSPTYRLDVSTPNINTFRTKNTTAASGNTINIHNDSNLGLNTTVYGSAYSAGSWLSLGANGVALHSNSTANFGILTTTSTSLLFGTNNVERMRIIANGNVGIGTSSPGYKLSVNGDASIVNNSSLILLDTAGNPGFQIRNTSSNVALIHQTNNGTLRYRAGFSSNSANAHIFAVGADTEIVRFTNDGNVGIGTSSPSAKLDISGNVAATGITSTGNKRLSLGILDINVNNETQIRINTTIPFASGAADFTVNIKGFAYGAEQMVSLSIGWHYYLSTFWNETAISNGAWSPTISLAKDANGFVVIYLPSPPYWSKLYVESVYSSAYQASYSSGWTWTNADLSNCTDISVLTYKPLATSITGSSGSTAAISGTTNYVSKFTTSSTLGNSLIYDNGTNVGIGTTSPNEKLTISGKIYAIPNLPVVLSGLGAPYYGTNITLASDIGSTQGANRIWSRYDGTGSGATTFERSTNSQSYNSDPQLLTYVESMRIAGNGNVGIGTSSPDQKLSIQNSGTGVSGIWQTFKNSSGVTEWGISEYSSGDFNIYESGVADARLYIKAGGNVGIGTTGPSIKLQVETSVNGSDGIWARNTNTGTSAFGSINCVSGVGAINLRAYSAAHTVWANTSMINSASAFTGGMALFQEGANPISLWTNGSERMRITSAGNVGIGTSSPSALLNVVGTADMSGLFETNNAGSAASLIVKNGNGTTSALYSYVRFINNNTNQQDWRIGTYSNNDFTFHNAKAATSPMVITTSGNVGIGTTAPGTKLDVVGTANTFASIGTTGASSGRALLFQDKKVTATKYNWLIGAQYNIDNAFEITPSTAIGGSTYSTPSVTILQSGNVGIGTTAPRTKLHIASTSSAVVSPVAGAATNSATIISTSAASYGLNFVPSGNGDIHLQAQRFDGTTTLYNINLNPLGGNVGIGTSSPAQKLDVNGNQRISGGLLEIFGGSTYPQLSRSGASGGLIINTSGAVSALASLLSVKNNSGSDIITMLGNGNVGIGNTAPTSKLVVDSNTNGADGIVSRNLNTGGSAYAFVGAFNNTSNGIDLRSYPSTNLVFPSTSFISSGSGQTGGMIITQAGANPISIWTNGSEKMRVTSDGNVGIGTTAPNAKLDVNGDALINQLTIGQGPVVGQGNTALGKGALGSMVGGKANIAVGSNANSDNDVTGLTVIGVDLNVNPAGSALTQNSLVIGQYNNLNYSTQYPHIYAPDKVNCPNGNTTTDVIAVDYSIYTAIFMEYSIFNSAGDQFRAGTYTAAFKGTGTVVEDDNQTVVYSGTTLAATFTTSVTGSVVTIQLRNQDSDTYDIRVTARLLMR